MPEFIFRNQGGTAVLIVLIFKGGFFIAFNRNSAGKFNLPSNSLNLSEAHYETEKETNVVR